LSHEAWTGRGSGAGSGRRRRAGRSRPSGVRGAVVDDPEHALGRCIGLFAHHLRDQPPEGLDPGLLLDPVEWFVVRSVKAVARAARIELTRDLPSRAGLVSRRCRSRGAVGAGRAARRRRARRRPLRGADWLPPRAGRSRFLRLKAGALQLPLDGKSGAHARHDGGVRESLLSAGPGGGPARRSRIVVYEQSCTGRIPTATLGTYRRYRREAVEAWVTSQGTAT
jgi:hypothetical protein